MLSVIRPGPTTEKLRLIKFSIPEQDSSALVPPDRILMQYCTTSSQQSSLILSESPAQLQLSWLHGDPRMLGLNGQLFRTYTVVLATALHC
jgi:hypothetical protein